MKVPDQRKSFSHRLASLAALDSRNSCAYRIFSESVAVFVQRSQPRTGGLVRAGSAMALSGRSRCISGFRANVCRRCLPSAAVAPENVGARPSAPSAPSAPTPKSNPANGFAAQSLWTVVHDADGTANGNAPTVRANSLEIQCRDRCGRCGHKWHPPFWCSGIARVGRQNRRAGHGHALIPSGAQHWRPPAARRARPAPVALP